MDGVWREVRYRRGGRRTYDPGWDRVTEAGWGKDSAPSRPFPARAQFPAPNAHTPTLLSYSYHKLFHVATLPW